MANLLFPEDFVTQPNQRDLLGGDIVAMQMQDPLGWGLFNLGRGLSNTAFGQEDPRAKTLREIQQILGTLEDPNDPQALTKLAQQVSPKNAQMGLMLYEMAQNAAATQLGFLLDLEKSKGAGNDIKPVVTVQGLLNGKVHPVVKRNGNLYIRMGDKFLTYEEFQDKGGTIRDINVNPNIPTNTSRNMYAQLLKAFDARPSDLTKGQKEDLKTGLAALEQFTTSLVAGKNLPVAKGQVLLQELFNQTGEILQEDYEKEHGYIARALANTAPDLAKLFGIAPPTDIFSDPKMVRKMQAIIARSVANGFKLPSKEELRKQLFGKVSKPTPVIKRKRIKVE